MSNKVENKMMKSAAKRALEPKLRFPEFRETGEWQQTELKRLAKRITVKNNEGKETRVLTNSAEYGIVDQRDYFDKDIANKANLEGCFIVERGDYVYNPRISTIAPVGPISRNNIGTGVMSPLYTVLRFNNSNNDFYAHYFKSTQWHQYLRQFSNSGARHDRMSITNGDFMDMPLPFPHPEEQQKVADCLSSIDELITVEAQKLDAFKAYKKGLLQQLFPAEGETLPRLRFPEFGDKWKENRLGTISDSISSGKDKSDPDGAYDLYGSTGVIGKTSSDTYNGKFLLVARVGANAGLLTKANGKFGVTDNTLVIHLKKPASIDFIFYYLDNLSLNKLIYGSGQPLITGGQLKALSIYLPEDAEQQKIADCLTPIDELITAQTQKLYTLQAHKKGLMQQLFPALDEVQE